MSVEKNKPYKAEELHRGDWIPLMAKNSKGRKEVRVVRITDSVAKEMNKDKKDTKIRYVEMSEKEFKALREKEQAEAEKDQKAEEKAREKDPKFKNEEKEAEKPKEEDEKKSDKKK